MARFKKDRKFLIAVVAVLFATIGFIVFIIYKNASQPKIYVSPSNSQENSDSGHREIKGAARREKEKKNPNRMKTIRWHSIPLKERERPELEAALMNSGPASMKIASISELGRRGSFEEGGILWRYIRSWEETGDALPVLASAVREFMNLKDGVRQRWLDREVLEANPRLKEMFQRLGG